MSRSENVFASSALSALTMLKPKGGGAGASLAGTGAANSAVTAAAAAAAKKAAEAVLKSASGEGDATAAAAAAKAVEEAASTISRIQSVADSVSGTPGAKGSNLMARLKAAAAGVCGCWDGRQLVLSLAPVSGVREWVLTDDLRRVVPSPPVCVV